MQTVCLWHQPKLDTMIFLIDPLQELQPRHRWRGGRGGVWGGGIWGRWRRWWGEWLQSHWAQLWVSLKWFLSQSCYIRTNTNRVLYLTTWDLWLLRFVLKAGNEKNADGEFESVLSVLSLCCHGAQLSSGPSLWSHVSFWVHSQYVAGWSPLSVQTVTTEDIFIYKHWERITMGLRAD